MSPNRPRVLVVTNMWPTEQNPAGGSFVEAAVESLRRVWPDAQIDVEVVVQGKGTADYFLGNLRVRRRLRTERYDVLWTHFGLTALCAALAPRQVPMVVSVYGSDVNVPWMRWVTRVFGRRAAIRIFVSSALSARWPAAGNLVIPNGVDFSIFRPMDGVAAREALGLARDRSYVLFGGNPKNPVKDYARYERVMDRLPRDLDAVPLHLSGGMDQEDVALHFQAADVLLFTSRRGSEGSPTVVKEALASSLPVVSVDVGDVRERTQGVAPGLVVPWGSDDQVDAALACGVEQVLRTGCRSNGRTVAENLRLEVIAERLAVALSDLMARTA